mmetsp:Transcript_11861/g.37688  ORF Transcript_11861/g.37688 Transcript_11861/m.37688 type:complete len:389 (-) Transcript_11861:630-1796(-)
MASSVTRTGGVSARRVLHARVRRSMIPVGTAVAVFTTVPRIVTNTLVSIPDCLARATSTAGAVDHVVTSTTLPLVKEAASWLRRTERGRLELKLVLSVAGKVVRVKDSLERRRVLWVQVDGTRQNLVRASLSLVKVQQLAVPDPRGKRRVSGRVHDDVRGEPHGDRQVLHRVHVAGRRGQHVHYVRPGSRLNCQVEREAMAIVDAREAKVLVGQVFHNVQVVRLILSHQVVERRVEVQLGRRITARHGTRPSHGVAGATVNEDKLKVVRQKVKANGHVERRVEAKRVVQRHAVLEQRGCGKPGAADIGSVPNSFAGKVERVVGDKHVIVDVDLRGRHLIHLVRQVNGAPKLVADLRLRLDRRLKGEGFTRIFVDTRLKEKHFQRIPKG